MKNTSLKQLTTRDQNQIGLIHLPFLKPVSALALASMLCCLMVSIRFIRTDTLKYGFLLWNLFLAWMPLVFAYWLYLKNYPKRFLGMPNRIIGVSEKLTFLTLLGCWLLFFPNAPYIVSDLVHLRWNRETIVWFDAVLFFCFASTGLQVGLFSLFLIQQTLNQVVGKWLSWHLIAVSIWLSGFGIYMGRDLRVNSWDLFTKPLELIQTIIQKFSIHGLNMTILYAVLIGTVYIIFRSLLTTKVQ
ncbi:MAG: DUF1361 domain-containing protein [Flammeovirgaceae bacterium]